MPDPRPEARYPHVETQPRFPEIERRVLAYWQREGIFRESVERRPSGPNGANEFVFYDGPPFANGLPHYGHLVTGFVKDIVPRYQTMRGRRVERRFGWDCHGLPAEMEAEKELGVSGRAQILEYGIARFNEHCRTSVMRYTHEWERYVTRQARWVDFTNDYKTMDLSYMESVIWAFKQLWDKGLVYEAERVLPYSWAAETPLSNFETRLDDSYRERQDPALTVRFQIENPTAEQPTELWAWTTTPWTLPSNLALAVGPGDRLRAASARRAPRADRGGGARALREGTRRRRTDRHARARAPRSPVCVTARSSRSSQTPETRSACSPPTSSRPTRAPASCTWRPASARTTSRSVARRKSRWWRRSTTPVASRTWSSRGRATTSSTPTRRSSRR